MEHKKMTGVDFLRIKHAMKEANEAVKLLIPLMQEYPSLEESATPEQYAELTALLEESDNLQEEAVRIQMAENHGN